MKVPGEYANFANVFSPNLVSKLSNYIGINNHAIELVDGQQLPYGPIYSQEPIELETLKAYIKINLANRFIRSSKLPVGASIFFDQKLNRFLFLCINYRSFNNLTIKNQYLLPLVGKSLDRLRRTKRFTQLDLTIAYYWIKICKKDKWKTAFKTWYGYFEY